MAGGWYKNGVGSEGRFIQGTQGTDILIGSNGNDTIFGHVTVPKGNDLINARVTADDVMDVIFAGAGDDWISAGGGTDIVFGGAGNDTINGGPGADSMIGGPGNDTFAFSVLFTSPFEPIPSSGLGRDNRDVIYDFRQGEDTIDLYGWENWDAPGSTFLGMEPGDDDQPALQVSYRHEDGNTIIELWRHFAQLPDVMYEPEGPVSEIQLTGRIDLVESDFKFYEPDIWA